MLQSYTSNASCDENKFVIGTPIDLITNSCFPVFVPPLFSYFDATKIHHQGEYSFSYSMSNLACKNYTFEDIPTLNNSPRTKSLDARKTLLMLITQEMNGETVNINPIHEFFCKNLKSIKYID
jgi:hypothetical protein